MTDRNVTALEASQHMTIYDATIDDIDERPGIVPEYLETAMARGD